MRLYALGALLGAVGVAIAASDYDWDAVDPSEQGHVFNGKEVPEMLELTPTNFAEEMKKSKYMLVKHYSPWCHHCQSYAPAFETTYEFYYTSAPFGKGNEKKNFTDFYSFRFATMNCVAYSDLCTANGVTSYPITTLYKDGVPTDTHKGVKSVEYLTEAIEAVLEKEKPGTRPNKLVVPTAGATAAPAQTGIPDATAAAAAKATSTTKPTKSGSNSELALKKPSKSHGPPNVNGLVEALTAESFQTRVTLTDDPWFIKFYAPWCHHCQAMASNWKQLAKEMTGKLNIGEVNCDKEKRLCKDVRVRGYPTILFLRGGERVEYEGLRGLGDFVHYADKAIDLAQGVQDVDAASLKTLEQKEEVIFIYFYDHATTSEDFMALERLPLSLVGHAKLVKTKDPILYQRYKITTWPRLLVSREGRPTYYTPLTPKEMRDTHQVLDWMKSVWLPVVPELTASNAREIMDGKLVVLGILNREDDESFAGAIREMKSAANEWMDKQIQLFQLERQELRDAKQLRIEEAEDRNDQRALRSAKSIRINMDRSDRKEVAFAFVDGVFWQRWIRTTYGIDAKDGDRVIINDEDVSSLLP
jgi:protein disulfide-isomerase